MTIISKDNKDKSFSNQIKTHNPVEILQKNMKCSCLNLDPMCSETYAAIFHQNATIYIEDIEEKFNFHIQFELSK